MIVKLDSSVLFVSASLYCRSCGKLTQSHISFEEHPFHFKASLVAQKVKCLPMMQETRFDPWLKGDLE